MATRNATLALMMMSALALPVTGAADTVALNPTMDNTLYERVDGALSNGAGEHMFSGAANDGERRRAVLAFDVSSIPSDATIDAVTLTLTMTRTVSGSQTHELFRLTESWGEGDSDAELQEGGGAPSAPGDATWIHTSFPDQMWSTEGGSFEAAASASASIAGTGAYVWTGPGLVSDVELWIAEPEQNAGWILVGNESTSRTAKRFATKDNSSEAQWPTLTVEFTPMTPTETDSWSGVKSRYGSVIPGSR